MQRGKIRPALGRVSGLLQQLPSSGRERLLSRVDLARGELDEHPRKRIAVLALEKKPSVVQPRDNHHRTRMLDIFARGRGAVGQADRVSPDVQQLALEDLLRGKLRLDEVFVVGSVAHDSQSRATRKSE